MIDLDFDLRKRVEAAGLYLADGVDRLRDQQKDALEWALGRPEPYLFINAPTGSGKTLLAGLYGILRGRSWTYGVHTIRLQEQVARTFTNLPVLTGRRNHPCWVGEQIYGVSGDYSASDGVCAVHAGLCNHGPRAEGDGYQNSTGLTGLCPYYAQMSRAMQARYRVTNYAMLLSLPPLQQRTNTLLADEGHNVEEAVTGNASVRLSRRTFGRFRIDIPRHGADMGAWGQWARRTLSRLPSLTTEGRPDFGLKTALDNVGTLRMLDSESTGDWLVEEDEDSVTFSPVWGRGFVMRNLFGHEEAPTSDIAEEAARAGQGVEKVLLLSATLMGAEYIASTLGFPDGSWAYLDLPSTFPVANRPVNFSPVVALSAKSTEEDYAKMQEAIDHLCEYYLLNGAKGGIIHAVSNKYRDRVLTSSRFRAIMRTDPEQHELAIKRGEASVLVAANLAEGWDGVDDLCRFVLIPKVPFPDLGDKRTSIRKSEDSRSYDHKALVAVVQGAGRGVRHRADYADTWILDTNWARLRASRKDWLPDAFTSAYNHRVALV